MLKLTTLALALLLVACAVDPKISTTTSAIDPCTSPSLQAGGAEGVDSNVRCTDNPPPPDAGASPISTLYAPVGAFCRPTDSYWCASYAGACVVNVCRAQCSAVSWPRCGAGYHEVTEDLGRGLQCYCAP